MERFKEERGTALVFAVVFMSISLLFLAMIFDLGSAWLAQTKLQTAADAASLAAVQERQVKTEYVMKPQTTATEIFETSDLIPPMEIVLSIEPETEPYVHLEPVIDPTTGKQKIDYNGTPLFEWVHEDIETGRFIVTYVKEWEEVLVEVRPVLRSTDAAIQSARVFNINLFNDSILGKAKIVDIVEGQTISTSNAIGYGIKVKANVPSVLLGPILRLITGQDAGNPTLTIQVDSESRAYLSP